MDFSSCQTEAITIDALSAYQAKDLVHEGRVVDRNGEVDVARMARTGLLAEVASRTAGEQTQWVSFHLGSAYIGTTTGDKIRRDREGVVRIGDLHRVAP